MCIETTKLVQRSRNRKPLSDASHSIDCIRDRLVTMFIQENADTYSCSDYIFAIMNGFETSSNVTLDSPNVAFGPTSHNNASVPIDTTCRVKMTQWCFSVVDYAKFQRSTVSIAMSFLDRYLSSYPKFPHAREAMQCRQAFQLACMSALFMAIKINETTDIDARAFSALSRGAFTAQDIVFMETRILQALGWRLNAPTAFDFLQHLVAILPSLQQQNVNGISDTVLSNIVDLSVFQIDLAVGDYFFVTQKQSTIAIASLWNVLEANVSSSSISIIPKNFFHSLVEEIRRFTNVNILSMEMQNMRSRLMQLLRLNNVLSLSMNHDGTINQYSSSNKAKSVRPSSVGTKMDKVDSRTTSPNCVSRVTKVAMDNASRTVATVHRSSSFHDLRKSFRRS